MTARWFTRTWRVAARLIQVLLLIVSSLAAAPAAAAPPIKSFLEDIAIREALPPKDVYRDAVNELRLKTKITESDLERIGRHGTSWDLGVDREAVTLLGRDHPQSVEAGHLTFVTRVDRKIAQDAADAYEALSRRHKLIEDSGVLLIDTAYLRAHHGSAVDRIMRAQELVTATASLPAIVVIADDYELLAIGIGESGTSRFAEIATSVPHDPVDLAARIFPKEVKHASLYVDEGAATRFQLKPGSSAQFELSSGRLDGIRLRPNVYAAPEAAKRLQRVFAAKISPRRRSILDLVGDEKTSAELQRLSGALSVDSLQLPKSTELEKIFTQRKDGIMLVLAHMENGFLAGPGWRVPRRAFELAARKSNVLPVIVACNSAGSGTGVLGKIDSVRVAPRLSKALGSRSLGELVEHLGTAEHPLLIDEAFARDAETHILAISSRLEEGGQLERTVDVSVEMPAIGPPVVRSIVITGLAGVLLSGDQVSDGDTKPHSGVPDPSPPAEPSTNVGPDQPASDATQSPLWGMFGVIGGFASMAAYAHFRRSLHGG